MKRQAKKGLRVFVAMSGGVDSSVATALLKKQGFDVIGVFMKPWSASAKASAGQATFCPWQKDREDAMRAASQIGIPLLTWDFSREYKKEVTDYMIKEYKAGRTPNPDVMCNKHIKFGLFLDKALKEGADFIATGHYVRKVESSKQQVVRGLVKKNTHLNTYYSLLTARDKNKDQSYFLWTLTQKQLQPCLFPIGDYTKPQVRQMAKRFGLPAAEKKDSQGVCFIGPLNMKDFLTKYIKPKIGEIITMSDLVQQGRTLNKVVGTHDGVYYYTIGQRHGLNIGNSKGPYFVIAKDLKKNIIYVGEKEDLKSDSTKITDINWINDNTRSDLVLRGCLPVEVKVRYRSRSEKAMLFKNGDLKFKKPIRAITSGQSAVFYKGQEMLGGGIIS